MSDAKKIIHPSLDHYGLTTANLEGMVKWYATVLGMSVVSVSPAPLGPHAPFPVSAAWVTHDSANHSIGLIATRQLTQDPEKGRHVRLQHIAYEYPSLDDLLSI